MSMNRPYAIDLVALLWALSPGTPPPMSSFYTRCDMIRAKTFMVGNPCMFYDTIPCIRKLDFFPR